MKTKTKKTMKKRTVLQAKKKSDEEKYSFDLVKTKIAWTSFLDESLIKVLREMAGGYGAVGTEIIIVEFSRDVHISDYGPAYMQTYPRKGEELIALHKAVNAKGCDYLWVQSD